LNGGGCGQGDEDKKQRVFHEVLALFVLPEAL
jgi:hypothetical protein